METKHFKTEKEARAYMKTIDVKKVKGSKQYPVRIRLAKTVTLGWRVSVQLRKYAPYL
jgi:hypothetical protein